MYLNCYIWDLTDGEGGIISKGDHNIWKKFSVKSKIPAQLTHLNA